MPRRLRRLLTAFLVTALAGVTTSCGDSAQEFKRLEGVWAEDPPKGGGRRNAVRFEGGKMGWQSTRYEGGEPMIGHSKAYEVRLDASSKPKRITLTRLDISETRLGIYEVDGDTLKMALGRDDHRPATMDDPDAQVMTLKRVRE